MRVKLIDYYSEEPKEVKFGTCELCYFTSTVQDGYFVFEANGEKITIPDFAWDWGDRDEVHIDNIIEFADFVSRGVFPDDLELGYWNFLDPLAYDYYYINECKREETNFNKDYLNFDYLGLNIWLVQLWPWGQEDKLEKTMT